MYVCKLKQEIFKDGTISYYDPDVDEPIYQLKEHTEDVTSLHLSKCGTLISGSYDKTAKVGYFTLDR